MCGYITKLKLDLEHSTVKYNFIKKHVFEKFVKSRTSFDFLDHYFIKYFSNPFPLAKFNDVEIS